MLDFSAYRHLSTAFLAAAVRRLFATHGKLHVTSHLFVANIVPEDNKHLFLVMRVANMKEEINRLSPASSKPPPAPSSPDGPTKEPTCTSASTLPT